MKINFIPTIIAIALSALVAYGCFSLRQDNFNNLLGIGCFVMMSIATALTLGLGFESSRTTTNIRVLSAIFTLIFLASNLIFCFISFSVPTYIITNGILLLIFILLTYSIAKAKQ